MIEKKNLRAAFRQSVFLRKSAATPVFAREATAALPFFPMRGRWAQDAVFGEKTVLNKYELFRADLDNAVGNAV